MGIGRKSGRNKARNTFDGKRWGEGSVGTNEVTGPAIQDTSWEKSKSGYGSGWQKPTWTTREERAQRRAERNAKRAEKKRSVRAGGLSKIIEDKKKNILKDPHADDDKGKMKLNRDGAIGYLEDMLMSGGSVISSNGGICLDGEENGVPSAADGETLVYSMKDGKRKWLKASSYGIGGVKTEVRNVVTAIRYDAETHQLLAIFEQVEVIKKDVGVKPEETVIFTATPLSAEIGQG